MLIFFCPFINILAVFDAIGTIVASLEHSALGGNEDITSEAMPYHQCHVTYYIICSMLSSF